MNKQPEITESTRKAFVDAVLLLLKEKPISKITVKEITAITGNNRATFYRYFEDVYSLYDRVCEEAFLQIAPKALEALQHVDDTAMFVELVVKLYEQWHPYLDMVFLQPQRRDISQMKEMGVSKIKETLALPKEAKFNYHIDCYFAIITSMVGRWVKHQDDITIEELALMIHEVIQTGIVNQLPLY